MSETPRRIAPFRGSDALVASGLLDGPGELQVLPGLGDRDPTVLRDGIVIATWKLLPEEPPDIHVALAEARERRLEAGQ